MPAAFTVRAGAATPTEVSVPAFLAVELDLRSGDGKLHRVRVATTTLVVPPGGRVRQTIEGLRAGRYALTVDGHASGAALVTGTEPGP